MLHQNILTLKWTVPQLSIMVNFRIILSDDNVIDTKESILAIYDKSYNTNKWILQKWEELDNLRNCALSQ